MRLTGFRAGDFRNIERADISFCPGVNLLFGENAQGKTNVIEGIYLFARGKSFRSSERELIRFGKEGFTLRVDYEDRSGSHYLEYRFLSIMRTEVEVIILNIDFERARVSALKTATVFPVFRK